MVGENILRALTVDENKSINEAGSRDLLDAFLGKLAVKRQHYGKLYQPFDAYSARIDFEESVRKTMGEVSVTVDKASNKQKRKLEMLDLELYATPDRFILIDVKATMEDKLLDGIRNNVMTGKSYRYKAKERGNTVTIFVPNDEVAVVEAWIVDNFDVSGFKDFKQVKKEAKTDKESKK